MTEENTHEEPQDEVPADHGNTMSGDQDSADEDDDGPDLIGLSVLIITAILGGVCWAAGYNLAAMALAVVLISIVIWQACDPFADAAQYIGERAHLPGSVRGATLDAIASSMPELFAGIFFVIVAISSDDLKPTDGYGSSIATCAGSAIYNMILIPACCAIFISFARPSRPTIDVEDEVIKRDGLWFLGCELVLLAFLFMDNMYWWMGVVFLLLYVGYVLHLVTDAKKFRRGKPQVTAKVEAMGEHADPEEVAAALRAEGVSASAALVAKMQEETFGHAGDEDIEDEDAGILFGFGSVKLTPGTSWLVIIVSTLVAAGACYALVELTFAISKEFDIRPFFVAVIVAAAASSVPDTFLSIGAARRGDDDGAVSNAFGSNIFDICICLSIPLFVNSYLLGWEPVPLTEDGKPIAGLVTLRIALWVLTLITLGIIWHKRQLTRNKAFILVLLYLVFIGLAIVQAQ